MFLVFLDGISLNQGNLASCQSKVTHLTQEIIIDSLAN